MLTPAQIARLTEAQRETRALLDAELAVERTYPAAMRKVGLIAYHEHQLAKLARALRESAAAGQMH